MARGARHSHPSPPEKKAASRKKSRLRRKKLRLTQKMAHRVYQGWHVPTCEWLATTDPPRFTAPAALSPSYASGFAFRLHGVVHDTPSPMAGFIFVARHKSGESYPFLNERAVLSGLKRKRRGEIRIF